MSITSEYNPITFSFSGPTRGAYPYIQVKLFVEPALHFNESTIDIGDSCLEKRGSHSMRLNLKLFVETALHFNESAIDIGDGCLDKRGNESQDNNVVGQLANGED
jgi:hypothetical protein